MSDLDHALSQLRFIQDRVAASTRFDGLAPYAVMSTGVVALLLAGLQTVWPEMIGVRGVAFVLAWVLAAIVATAIVAIEMLERSHRLHGAMASTLIAGTLRLLLPFGAVGMVITMVIVMVSPATIWVLPGVWQMLIALLGYAATSTLPRAIIWPANWYFLCGAIVLVLAGQSGAPSPWMMGLPFGIGQMLVAVVLHRHGGRRGY